MITQTTIDEVRHAADIFDVVRETVSLKRSGAGYIGLCPFHDEKTGSFNVSQTRQMYKCFGCGKGGDVFRFVMDTQRKTFYEAIEYLAAKYNITVQLDKAQKEESQEKKDEKLQMLELVSFAQKKYEDLLTSLPDDAPAVQYLAQRGYTREKCKTWSIGVAPDEWKFLTTPIINMGRHTPAVQCGIINTSNGNTYDFLRHRITIPIHDNNGKLLGHAGRIIPGADSEKQSKYLNPKESPIYSKSKIWYGLWQAQRAIKELECAYITEGYMDVQSLHDAGVCNAVASCGTEIHDNQLKLLKRYTEHACILYDGDTAGQNKSLKQVDAFLKHGFKVSIITLPEAQDPDEYVRNFFNPQNKVAI